MVISIRWYDIPHWAVQTSHKQCKCLCHLKGAASNQYIVQIQRKPSRGTSLLRDFSVFNMSEYAIFEKFTFLLFSDHSIQEVIIIIQWRLGFVFHSEN